MAYYNIEIIDISDQVENFKFHKILELDMVSITKLFKNNSPYIEFNSEEGFIILRTEHIRGIMYKEYVEKEKTVVQENIESAKEISKVKLKKTIFNSTGDIK